MIIYDSYGLVFSELDKSQEAIVVSCKSYMKKSLWNMVIRDQVLIYISGNIINIMSKDAYKNILWSYNYVVNIELVAYKKILDSVVKGKNIEAVISCISPKKLVYTKTGATLDTVDSELNGAEFDISANTQTQFKQNLKNQLNHYFRQDDLFKVNDKSNLVIKNNMLATLNKYINDPSTPEDKKEEFKKGIESLNNLKIENTGLQLLFTFSYSYRKKPEIAPVKATSKINIPAGGVISGDVYSLFDNPEMINIIRKAYASETDKTPKGKKVEPKTEEPKAEEAKTEAEATPAKKEEKEILNIKVNIINYWYGVFVREALKSSPVANDLILEFGRFFNIESEDQLKDKTKYEDFNIKVNWESYIDLSNGITEAKKNLLDKLDMTVAEDGTLTDNKALITNTLKPEVTRAINNINYASDEAHKEWEILFTYTAPTKAIKYEIMAPGLKKIGSGEAEAEEIEDYIKLFGSGLYKALASRHSEKNYGTLTLFRKDDVLDYDNLTENKEWHKYKVYTVDALLNFINGKLKDQLDRENAFGLYSFKLKFGNLPLKKFVNGMDQAESREAQNTGGNETEHMEKQIEKHAEMNEFGYPKTLGSGRANSTGEAPGANSPSTAYYQLKKYVEENVSKFTTSSDGEESDNYAEDLENAFNF